MNLDFTRFFVPKDHVFKPLFFQGSQNILQVGNLLVDMVNEKDVEKRGELIRRINATESQNDEVTHRIMNALSKTFITPFDREDIHRLASLVDDVIDVINVVAKKINIYSMDPHTDKSILKLSELIQSSCYAIHTILNDISFIKKDISDRMVIVHTIENQADDIHDMALKELFERETDVKEIIKKKEIYKHMESATDKCEEVMHVMESIHIKYS